MWQRNATLVAIFANYLLIDVLITAGPRLLAILWFPEIRNSVCSPDSINAWLQAQEAISGEPRRAVEPVGQTVEINRVQDMAEHEMRAQCTHVVAVLQVLVALVAVGGTIVQVLLAIRVSRYASVLVRRESERKERVMEAASELGSVWGGGYIKGYRDSVGEERFGQTGERSEEV